MNPIIDDRNHLLETHQGGVDHNRWPHKGGVELDRRRRDLVAILPQNTAVKLKESEVWRNSTLSFSLLVFLS